MGASLTHVLVYHTNSKVVKVKFFAIDPNKIQVLNAKKARKCMMYGVIPDHISRELWYNYVF